MEDRELGQLSSKCSFIHCLSRILYSSSISGKFIKTQIQRQCIYIPYNGIAALDVGKFAGHTKILKYAFELIFSEHIYSIMYY